jgi:chitin disaccharide deacetylase
MRKLIINADDYGLTRGVSQGIRSAFAFGAISSATAMTNIPGAVRGLEIAQRDMSTLPIGVHLNLTVGAPVAPVEEIPTLVDGRGRFFSREAFLERLDHIDPKEAGVEFRAQIDVLRRLGIRPDHLDSHHFISYLTPELLGQMLRLADEHHLAVRPPAGCDGPMTGFFPDLPEACRAFLQNDALTMIHRAAVPTADRLYLSFYDKTATLKNLQWILSDLPEGTSEIMSHPGLADDELRNISDYAEERGYELSLLTESSLPALLTEMGIQLTSYAQLDA